MPKMKDSTTRRNCRSCRRLKKRVDSLTRSLSATRFARQALREQLYESREQFCHRTFMDSKVYETYRFLFFRLQDLADGLSPILGADTKVGPVVPQHWKKIREALDDVRLHEHLVKEFEKKALEVPCPTSS